MFDHVIWLVGALGWWVEGRKREVMRRGGGEKRRRLLFECRAGVLVLAVVLIGEVKGELGLEGQDYLI